MTGYFYLLKKYILLLSLGVFLMSSCGSYKKSTLFNSEYDVLADTAKSIYVANAQPEKEYTLQYGDRIIIKNLQDPRIISENSGSESKTIEESSGYLLQKDGTVLLPVIGKVMLAGFTADEAREAIEVVYKQKLLKDPLIELTISNFNITVLGEFSQQGRINLADEETTIVEVLGIAGGITPKAEIQKLKIIRGDLKNPEIIFVNLNDINSLASNKIILKNNDILYIPQKRNSYRRDKVQDNTSLIQPIILILNTVLIFYNLTR